MNRLQTPIAIVGMGLSGEAAQRLLEAQGIDDFFTFDAKAGLAELSDPAALVARKPRTLIVSPGVPLATPWIQELASGGVRITSELALAVEQLTSEQIIGVTGSVGKSTTVALLEAGLAAFSPDSFVGGNIGRPLADYVADILLEQRPRRAPWIVLELSSYQLENMGALSLKIGAITYFTPNHLERYPSLAAYYDTKWLLVERVNSKCILNQSGGELYNYSHKQKTKVSIENTDHTDPRWKKRDLGKAALLGLHNQDNLAVAAAIAEEAGWPESAYSGMWRFAGLPHRMQTIAQIKGVRFVNDSKATTMESVRTAVAGVYPILGEKNSLWLLLGGKDKNLPWEELQQLKKFPFLKALFFGACAERAQAGSGLAGPQFTQLEPAAAAAFNGAKNGDIVLLSPGGTSLDEFKNFEDRGNKFAEYISNLSK